MVRVMESLAAQEVERQELLRSLQLQADRIADKAQARVQASGAAILETLAPELSRLVQRTVHQRLWTTLKLRALLAAAGAGVGLAAAIFAVSYGAGYAAGRIAVGQDYCRGADGGTAGSGRLGPRDGRQRSRSSAGGLGCDEAAIWPVSKVPGGTGLWWRSS